MNHEDSPIKKGGNAMKKSIINLIPVVLLSATLAPLSSTLADGCFVRADCKPTSTQLITGYQFDGRSVGIEIPAGKAHFRCVVINPVKSGVDLIVAVNHKYLGKPILGSITDPQPVDTVLQGDDFISFTQIKPKKLSKGLNDSPHYVFRCDVLTTE